MRPSLEFVKKKFPNKKLIGAEIGVYLGENAIDIFKNMDVYLMLVDACHYTNEKLKENLIGFESRYEIIEDLSCAAVSRFEENYFDFVYIDTDHSYESVIKDLKVWYRKIKNGGILCGHDFYISGHGVEKAVREFVELNNLSFCVEKENDCEWFENTGDWWIEKP